MSDSSTRRYACYLVTAMVLTLWFALSPSQEKRVRVSDPSFQLTEAGDTRRKYKLSLELEQGKTYRVEETTRHTAMTRSAKPISKNTFEVLTHTEYLTSVVLDLQVSRVNADSIECKAVLRDFVGYEEVQEKGGKGHVKVEFEHDDDEDGDSSDEEDRRHRNREMFSKVRDETRDTEFKLVLSHQGTVLEMDTYRLRERIISALHEVGQLPMHLEHAVLVNGYDVFPANGASFGPLGKTNVRGPVYRMKGTGCEEKHIGYSKGGVKGRILIVDRGDCTFNRKAQIAGKFDAMGLIVIDQQTADGAVMTYMSGEADVGIVAVIVNKDAGDAIEAALKNAKDFATLPNGDMTGSDKNLVEILGGVEAVQALTEELESDDDGEEDVMRHKKYKTHSYNPVHSDGLHDFVGIGYVVDEVIRTRFSIFPPSPVSIGSSWQRTLMLSDGIDPSVQAEVSEKYKLASISRAETRFNAQVDEGDLIAEIEVSAREKPASTKPGLGDSLPIGDDEDDEDAEKITPQFARPSFRGHDFTTKGTFFVHLRTGFVLGGQSTSEATSQRTVMVINRQTKKKKTLNANVDITAVTDYTGAIT